jgi:hypothetical protein
VPQLTKSQIHEFIEEAKNLVDDEEEPFKTAAFQVILSRLISGEGSSESSSNTMVRVEAKQEEEQTIAKISIAENIVNYISSLGDPDKIPILWSMSDREWMKIDDFLSASADAGMTIAKSWSPKQGGNFNNRLYREKKLFVKKGEGKEATYKLSAEGKQKVKELLKSTE